MPQVQKDDVRARIERAALALFAEHGFRGTAMADVAERAGVAVANLYRYYANKQTLFDAVVPAALADRHRALLERTVHSLAYVSTGAPPGDGRDSEALLQLWLAHPHAIAVLLDRAADTTYADYGARFVHSLVTLTIAELRASHPDVALSRDARQLLGLLFDNTRRTIAALLRTCTSERALRQSITLFRSYQMAGLAALFASLGVAPR